MVDVATRMAQRGWVVFAVNYRLNVPEAFPAEIDDVQTAVKWARLNAYDYRLDPGLMGALGFSAGGHLAAMLATLGDGPPDRNARILVAASWSGPMDLTALAAAGGDELTALSSLLLPCPPATCPERWDAASPITHVDPTDAALLLANSSDELVPVDQAQAMAARLDADGVANQLVIVPGRRHGRDLVDDVWPQTVAFLDHYLTRPDDLRDPNPTWGTWVLLVVIVVVVDRRGHRRPAGAAPPQPGGNQADRRGHPEVVGREQLGIGGRRAVEGEPGVVHHHPVVDEDVVEHRAPARAAGGNRPGRLRAVDQGVGRPQPAVRGQGPDRRRAGPGVAVAHHHRRPVGSLVHPRQQAPGLLDSHRLVPVGQVDVVHVERAPVGQDRPSPAGPPGTGPAAGAGRRRSTGSRLSTASPSQSRLGPVLNAFRTSHGGPPGRARGRLPGDPPGLVGNAPHLLHAEHVGVEFHQLLHQQRRPLPPAVGPVPDVEGGHDESTHARQGRSQG